MQIPTKKLRGGFEIPVLGLGTWQMGGRNERDLSNDDQADIRAIQTAIELGITHIDTAESYAAGHSEELIGKAIKGYDRSKLVIVSKARAEHLSYQDLLNAAKDSLKRLGTDYLDVYLMHRHNPSIPLEESMKALDALVKEGLIRYIGVSNFLPQFLNEAQSLTKNKIVCNQVHYNLMYREPETSGLLQYCQDNDIFLVAYRPLSKGSLPAEEVLVVKELTQKYGKTPYQIAINWLSSQNHVVALVKSSNVDHLKENVGSVSWQMDKEDIERLRKEFPNQQEKSDVVPLA